MCGRITIRGDTESLLDNINLAVAFHPNLAAFSANYDLKPTQSVLTVAREGTGFELRTMRWGLIPFWAKDIKAKPQPFNARADGVLEKPMFKKGMTEKRCLVLADGFYEWHTDENEKKTRYFIHLPGEHAFAFPGIWGRWTDPDGKEIDSCTILTTDANDIMKPVHDRMPLILTGKLREQWMNAKNAEDALALALASPAMATLQMRTTPGPLPRRAG